MKIKNNKKTAEQKDGDFEVLDPDEKKRQDAEIIDVSQLDLFSLVDSSFGKGNYSNTIENWDAMPKYVWTANRDQYDLDKADITRNYSLRGRDYKVVLHAAVIKKSGKGVLMFAGRREELVEDALRKLAVEGQLEMYEGEAGVYFTLYQVREELKNMGHNFSIVEIKEAIQICHMSSIELFGDGGETVVSASYFPMVALTSKSEYTQGKIVGDTRCFLTFNPLVSRSIKDITFRPYNYALAMSITSPMALYIYKRMSHYWVQASEIMPYTPSLMSFLEQSPRGLSPTMSANVRAMSDALSVLITKNVIEHYDAVQIKKGKKLMDVRYTIFPTAAFVEETIKRNSHVKKLRSTQEVSKARKSLGLKDKAKK